MTVEDQIRKIQANASRQISRLLPRIISNLPTELHDVVNKKHWSLLSDKKKEELLTTKVDRLSPVWVTRKSFTLTRNHRRYVEQRCWLDAVGKPRREPTINLAAFIRIEGLSSFFPLTSDGVAPKLEDLQWSFKVEVEGSWNGEGPFNTNMDRVVYDDGFGSLHRPRRDPEAVLESLVHESVRKIPSVRFQTALLYATMARWALDEGRHLRSRQRHAHELLTKLLDECYAVSDRQAELFNLFGYASTGGRLRADVKEVRDDT